MGGRKKSSHISSRIGKQLMPEILDGHEKYCRVALHMEPNIFRDISSYLREENLLCDTRGVRVEEQLGMFMFMLSDEPAILTLEMSLPNKWISDMGQ
jgi:hypothetical protein